ECGARAVRVVARRLGGRAGRHGRPRRPAPGRRSWARIRPRSDPRAEEPVPGRTRRAGSARDSGDMDTSPLAPADPSAPTTPHPFVPTDASVPTDAPAPALPHAPASTASRASAPPPAPGVHPAARPGAVHPAPVLSARGLFMTYGTAGTTTRALDGVDLDVGRADSLAVMGPSGCGKPTVLHILAGMLTPTPGAVLYAGPDLAGLGDRRRTRLRRSDVGFVFQDGQLLPELTALENVILSRMLGGISRRAATAEAASWLDRLGLTGMHDRRPTQLSGGQ